VNHEKWFFFVWKILVQKDFAATIIYLVNIQLVSGMVVRAILEQHPLTSHLS
jgi:hypothetical protein